jgi:hypothetical protein
MRLRVDRLLEPGLELGDRDMAFDVLLRPPSDAEQ